MTMRVPIYECRACGQRYPLMPYYPAAAPHGPDKNCRGELGWEIVMEDYPPVSRRAEP